MIAHDDSDKSALPSLQELRRKTNLTSRQIAEIANVPLRIEYLMEIGGSVEQKDAERILGAFSQLTGEAYSLSNVQVHLLHHAFHVPKGKQAAGKSSLVAPTIRKVKLFS